MADTADAVVVAYVYSPTTLTYSWHHSMMELLGWDLANEQRVMRGGYIAMRYGTDGLQMARNKAVKDFLSEKEADWLFWVDTDMGFPPDIVDRLMEAADPVERPIVGALAFSQREEVDDGMGGFRCRATPTIFDWTQVGDQMGFAIRFDYPLDTLIRCGGTGSACVLIHRSVFDRIEEKYGRAWYDRVPNTSTGQVLSEDLAFCLRAGTLEIPVHIHTGVKTTHYKNLWLAEDDYWAQVALSNLQEKATPVATESVQVIVPVLGRPQNAQPFMDSLRATSELATVYAICETDDTDAVKAWDAAGAIIQIGTEHTFAEKVNAAPRTDDPWVLLVGSDVVFRPRWLDHALAAAGEDYNVVGTNDLGNPRVIRGEHATHMLIRRSYIDEQGASWDGPGVICHDYTHWFVDDEIVTVAKQRGTWISAQRSIIEHLHPLWGKAPDDETYRIGRESNERDQAEFMARLEEHVGAGV